MDLKGALSICLNPVAPACKTGVELVFGYLGCCVGSFLRYLDYLNMVNASNIATSSLVDSILTLNGFQNVVMLPQSTCAQKALNLSVTFWNAKYAAYQAQVKLVTSKTVPALLQNLWFSLLQYLELDATQVTLDWTKGLVDDGNGNVQLKFTATFDSDAEATQSAILYQDSNNINNCTLGDVNANPYNTRVDSTAEVSLSAQSVSVQSINDCNVPANCTFANGACACPSLPTFPNATKPTSSASNTLRSSFAVVSLIALVGSFFNL